jgi:hypothetical protein
MAPIHLVLVEDADGVAIFGVNETELSFAGELRYGVFDLAGGEYPLDFHLPVVIPANSAREIAGFSRDQWTDPTTSIAFATLHREGRLVARNRLILPFFKDLHWPPATPADITITRHANTVTFTSTRFIFGVCLDLTGETPLADNFFDLYPNQPHTLLWPHESDPKIQRIGNL